MAAILTLSLQTDKHLSVSREAILSQVERTEKKTFPRYEAFNFRQELSKRNAELVIVLNEADIVTAGSSDVAAYSVFVHSKPGNVVMLHKICVLGDFRRKGIAKTILATQTEKYRKRGCSKIQLWVDEQNMPARRLYESVGFQEKRKVDDYYAPGRVGLQMSLDLT